MQNVLLCRLSHYTLDAIVSDACINVYKAKVLRHYCFDDLMVLFVRTVLAHDCIGLALSITGCFYT